MNDIINILEAEKLRLLDLRLLLCKHSRSGAHNRLVGATDALNQAISDIKTEMKKGKT
ncbi:MAG: hypothetical protein ACXW0Q_07400 [Methylovulum sp.]